MLHCTTWRRLVLALASVAATAAAVAAPAWDTPTPLTPAISNIQRPGFDTAGNAVTMGYPGTPNAVLLRSVGSSGAWAPALPVPIDAAEQTAGTRWLASGADGTAALLYAARPDGAACQMRLRLATVSGWLGPFVVDSVQACEGQVQFDAQGRVVVVYGPSDAAGNRLAPKARVFDPVTQQFGPVQTLAPAGSKQAWLTLARNPSGSAMAATWMDASAGVRVSSYDAATAAWHGAELLTGTLQAGGFGTVAQGSLQTAVDNSGNITVIVPLLQRQRVSVQGHRRSASGWAAPQTLLRPSAAALTVPTNGASRSPSIAVNAAGEVLATIGVVERRSGKAVISAYRYRSGAGWSTETVATVATGQAQLSDVAWLGSSGQALVVYPDFPNAAGIVRAVVHDGSGWNLNADLQIGPGSIGEWYLASAPGGEVLLVLAGSTGTGVVTRTAFAAWMRP